MVGLLNEFQRDLRRLVSEHRRVPGELEFVWTLNSQILARVDKNTPILGLAVDSKIPADDSVQFDVNYLAATRTHPAPQTFRVEPHVEDFFARGGHHSGQFDLNG